MQLSVCPNMFKLSVWCIILQISDSVHICANRFACVLSVCEILMYSIVSYRIISYFLLHVIINATQLNIDLLRNNILHGLMFIALSNWNFKFAFNFTFYGAVQRSRNLYMQALYRPVFL